MEARKLIGVLQDALNATKRGLGEPKPKKQPHDVEYLVELEARYALTTFQDMINELKAVEDLEFSAAHRKIFLQCTLKRESLIERTPADYFQRPKSHANELFLTAARFINEYSKSAGLEEADPYELLLPETFSPFAKLEIDKLGYLVAQEPSDLGYEDLKTSLLRKGGIKCFADRDHLIDHLALKVARSEWDKVLSVLMREECLQGEGKQASAEQIQAYQKDFLNPFKAFALGQSDVVTTARDQSFYNGNLRHDYAAIYLLAKLYSVERSLQPETKGLFGRWTGYDRDTKLTALDVLMDYLASEDNVEDLKPWSQYLDQDLAVFVEKNMNEQLDEKVEKALADGKIKDTDVDAHRQSLLDAEVKNIKGATGASTVGWITQQLGVIQKKYSAEQEKAQQSESEHAATLN